MATIDPNIALGVRPVQIENPLNQLAAYSQIQRGQQDQQLNMLKMQEYQRGLEEENKLRTLLSGGGDINSPDVIRQMYGISPTKGWFAKYFCKSSCIILPCRTARST